jgi:hypothetical protein
MACADVATAKTKAATAIDLAPKSLSINSLSLYQRIADSEITLLSALDVGSGRQVAQRMR